MPVVNSAFFSHNTFIKLNYICQYFRSKVCKLLYIYSHPDLGTRQHVLARDNVTIFHDNNLLIIACCLYFVQLLHSDTKALKFFKCFLVTEALIRCRVDVVAKIKKLWRAQLCSYTFTYLLQQQRVRIECLSP